jgi:hypothetical protein
MRVVSLSGRRSRRCARQLPAHWSLYSCSFCARWDSKGASQLHPVLLRKFGKARRSSLFPPAEGGLFAVCPVPNSAARLAQAGPADRQDLCEQSAVLKDFVASKFYPSGRHFTREISVLKLIYRIYIQVFTWSFEVWFRERKPAK